MKQEFYAFFLAKTHHAFVSRCLAHCAYMVCIWKYLLKKWTTKAELVCCENARSVIENVYPKPNCIYDDSRKSTNTDIDISVIIPIYNYRDIIQTAIESVLNQKTKYHFEVILVDDGSTDGSSEIVDQYSNRAHVKVIHQINKGIGGARNAGLRNAEGQYVMFVDCDDFVHEDFIEVMLDEAYRTNDDIVICGYSLIKKKEGKIISQREILYSDKNLMGYKDPEDRIMNYQGLPWNKIYRRALFERAGYIEGYWYEDTITQFLIFRQCRKYAYVKHSLYDYMWYEKNFSHTQAEVSPKSLERYWLLEVMAEEQNRIGLQTDRGFYKVLLRHMGCVFYSGIHGFDKEIEEAAFAMGCDILQRYKPAEKYHLTYMERELENALIDRDIAHWRLVCKIL